MIDMFESEGNICMDKFFTYLYIIIGIVNIIFLLECH